MQPLHEISDDFTYFLWVADFKNKIMKKSLRIIRPAGNGIS